MEKREEGFGQVSRALRWTHVIFGAALIVLYALRGDWFYFGISLGVPLVPAALSLVWRLLGMKPVRQLEVWILLFVFLSYPLGCCAGVYRIIPGFDKVAHMLSGAFVGLLSLALYYALKPGHRIECRDRWLALMFLFLGSMAVAGLWELTEYGINMITGIDVQCVQATGVSDTMKDMLVCMLGTIAIMPAASAMCRGRRNALSDCVGAFIAVNYR